MFESRDQEIAAYYQERRDVVTSRLTTTDTTIQDLTSHLFNNAGILIPGYRTLVDNRKVIAEDGSIKDGYVRQSRTPFVGVLKRVDFPSFNDLSDFSRDLGFGKVPDDVDIEAMMSDSSGRIDAEYYLGVVLAASSEPSEKGDQRFDNVAVAQFVHEERLQTVTFKGKKGFIGTFTTGSNLVFKDIRNVRELDDDSDVVMQESTQIVGTRRAGSYLLTPRYVTDLDAFAMVGLVDRILAPKTSVEQS